jgi:pachytene checkpoint protein 2
MLGGSMPCILNYSTLKEKQHCPEPAESNGVVRLSSLLHEAAELCEVNNKIADVLFVVTNTLHLAEGRYLSLLQGLSGRSLRKLPFLAHASAANPTCCDACVHAYADTDITKRDRGVTSLSQPCVLLTFVGAKCY